MQGYEKKARERWIKTKARGRVRYALRWILEFIFSFILFQVISFVFSDRFFEYLEIIAMVCMAVIFGIIVSIMMWTLFERKYKQE
jgi:glycerol uptake facilitator-like aquaporin